MSSPAPKSPEVSDKSKKYDRQIRLWGEHGQQALESAQVCLLNATCLGTEILKGIVLPGVGGFTIVDGRVVTEEDVGCNFFLEPTSVGQSRAQCCSHLLQELNPDVNGDYVDENIDSLLVNNPDFFKNFDLVIGTALSEKSIVTLSNKLWDLNIPFLVCRSVGFLGSARLQIREHCIIESHPDNRSTDLRLEVPFPALREHMNSVTVTPKVPWLVVLYKFLQEWAKDKPHAVPKNYKEKTELRELIRNAMGKDEENHEEAIKAVNSSFSGGKASSNLQKLLDDPQCQNLKKESKPFWILVRALKDFVANEGHGWLPLPGILPDMTAETAFYIALQNVYRNQALADADSIYRRVQQLLKEVNLPCDVITEKDVRLFCREAAHISVHRGSRIADEYEKAYKCPAFGDCLEVSGTLIEHYVALRAMERFHTEHGCLPAEVETDTARLKNLSGKLFSEMNLSSLSDELAHELCRYGGAEVHSVSSFLGGCVAQEVIKIITKQFKPINNTFIYNAVKCETATYEL
ncbi:nedd8-activating enzyme E1 regulatory subunit [Phlebotomus argentipes]|uniref:nedd8-activating enzyme E1 regulatory subunit n=1 Tax=Phlebotomus argentipes TaxID=94469 RepID=UPI002892AF22|nr:nedd8-activating enzyme E1 regulatory subunit [Phlebotomus argentipes]